MADLSKKRVRRADGYSLAQRKDGRWEARITVGYNEQGNPKRKSFYAPTRSEALELAQRFKLQLDSGGFAPLTKDCLVGEWLDRWMDVYIRPHREPKTVDFYEANIRLHLKPALGRVALRKLTAQEVQKLLNSKAAAGRSANFVRGLRATLRSALTQAWKEGLVEQNVASRVSTPRVEQRDPEFLSPEEVRKFLEAAKGHSLEQLFRFAVITGVRIGEASGIRWSDVYFGARTVQIRKQLQRIDGKLVLKDLKSKSSRRVLPLVGLALEALQDQRSSQLVSELPNPMDLVFLNAEGRPLDQKYVHKHLKLVLASAGVKQVSFHKLRHTAATLMVAAGVELHQVKEICGHGQISLTANLYAHGVTEAKRRASQVLNDVIRDGLPKNG